MTHKKILTQDRLTNLRRNSGNLKDLTDFKRLSKNMELPLFRFGSGELGSPEEPTASAARQNWEKNKFNKMNN